MANVYDIINPVLNELGISISFEKMYGLDLFPKCTEDNNGTVTIYENDKLYHLLLLYNLAIVYGYKLGFTINRLNLFYSLLELNDYEGASNILDQIIVDIESCQNQLSSSDKISLEVDSQEFVQHLFILLHEVFHIVIENNHSLALVYLNMSQNLINEILEFELNEYNLCKDDLSSNERILRAIDSLIPDSLSKDDKEFMQSQLIGIADQLKAFYDTVISIKQSGKHYIVKEIACDLFAWIFMANLICPQKEDHDLIEINAISLGLLYAMEFNENILSQFRPKKHAKYEYNGIRASIRQKCLRYALNWVSSTAGIKYYWKDLDSNFKKVFKDSINFIQLDDFTRTYKVFTGLKLPYNKQKEGLLIDKINSLFSTFNVNNDLK